MNLDGKGEEGLDRGMIQEGDLGERSRGDQRTSQEGNGGEDRTASEKEENKEKEEGRTRIVRSKRKSLK